MPVYNTSRYVAEAVESILAQTFADFELLIVDDGSTDGSPGILRSLAEKDTRIRLVCRENRGVCATRNEILSMAQGEFIAVMDSDDVALPHRFETQVAYLNSHPECLAVGTGALLIDTDGDPINELPLESEHEAIDAAHMKGFCGAICHTSTLFRRDAVLAVGGYAEDVPGAEDYDLYLKLAERGRLHTLPRVLVKYRQHLASIGYSGRLGQLTSAGLAFRRACERRGLEVPARIGGFAEWIKRPFRPTREFQRWGWCALAHGNVATARKYAWRTLVRRPHTLESWRLVYCALRGF